MKQTSRIIKDFNYTPSKEMSPTYLRDKFARIRAQQKKEAEVVKQEQAQKVRKIK